MPSESSQPEERFATLMCVYAQDNADHFRLALESVLGQTLRHPTSSRVYLGIDGPLPAPLNEVVAHFAPRLFRICRSDTNRGLAITLNGLLKVLDDEAFIFRMDADDVSMPTRFQAQLDYMQEHPDIDVLGTALLEIDERSRSERIVHFCTGPQDAVANAHKRVPVAHPTVCVRRRVFDAVGGYPVAGTNEDVALWFDCMALGFRFDNLRAPLLQFRLSPGFWKRRGFDKALSELNCYCRGIRRLRGLWTTDYLFPLMRFLLRLAPEFIVVGAYRSGRLRRSTP